LSDFLASVRVISIKVVILYLGIICYYLRRINHSRKKAHRSGLSLPISKKDYSAGVNVASIVVTAPVTPCALEPSGV